MDENSQHDVLSRHADPAFLARENASLRERLAALEQANVVTGQFRGEVPRYQLNEPCFLDDTFFDRNTVVEWVGVPNLSMVPMNEPARRLMEQFVQDQTEAGRIAALRNGRPFAGLTNDRGLLLEAALEDARRVAQDSPAPVVKMPEPIGDVPPMPHTMEAQAAKARRGRQPRAVAVEGRPAPVDRGAPTLAPTDPTVVARMVS